MIDFTKFALHSDFNYLKRANLEPHQKTITPVFLTFVTETVPLPGGYVPMVYVGAELTGDGVLWSNNIVDIYTVLPVNGSGSDYPEMTWWLTENTLTLGIYDGTPFITPIDYDIPMYAVNYLDYQT